MANFEEDAHKYAAQLTVAPPDLMVERLEFAAQAYLEGQAISRIEKQQTENLKWITKEPFAWKLSGWRPGMPGALTTRDAKDVKLLRRGPGRHARNWPAEKFLEGMIDVAELLRVEPTAPNWDNRERSYMETSFSVLCDGWLSKVAPDAKISPQSYYDILKRLNKNSTLLDEKRSP